MQCNATSKQSGQQCKASAVTGRSVCRIHGGATLIGSASGTFKHGRYSKSLPPHLRSRYETAAADPELLGMRDEVALLDARIGELVDRLAGQNLAERWEAVRLAYRMLRRARADADEDATLDVLDRPIAALGATIDAATPDDPVWQAIGDVIEQRRKVSESERKRLVDLQQMITTEQALVLVAQLADAVTKHVHDRPTLSAINAEFGRLVGLPTLPGPGDGGEGRRPA